MKPDQVSRRLRLVADGIDMSREPSRELAVDSMKRIMVALDEADMKAKAEPVEVEEAETGILAPQTEYSLQLDLSLSADFEGSVDKQALINKFKADLTAAIKSGMAVTARELKLTPVGARVKPIKIECSVTETEPDPEPQPE